MNEAFHVRAYVAIIDVMGEGSFQVRSFDGDDGDTQYSASVVQDIRSGCLLHTLEELTERSVLQQSHPSNTASNFTTRLFSNDEEDRHWKRCERMDTMGLRAGLLRGMSRARSQRPWESLLRTVPFIVLALAILSES